MISKFGRWSPQDVGSLRAGDEVVVIAHGVSVAFELVNFLVHRVGQDVVGKFGARSHLVIDDHDRFDELIVFKDLSELIDAAVLVDERVALSVPNELDVVRQVICAAHSRVLGGH